MARVRDSTGMPLRLLSTVTSLVQATRAAWLFAALLPLMILLTPPNGVLNENEQHYFEVARALVAPENTSALRSLIGGMPHTFVFSWVTGHLIEALGYGGAQIAGRLLVALMYAVALTFFFRKLAASVTDALAAVLLFYVAGQQIIGGEWMFGGFEPKTLAYPLLIAGVGAYFARERFAPWLWLAAATTVHFHLGGLWFGLIVLCELLQRRPLRELGMGVLLYAIASAPVAIVVVVNHLDLIATANQATGPDVGWIFTYYRAPHHATPFANRASFISDWLPGITLLAPLTALSLWLSRLRNSAVADPARLAFVAFCFLWLALAVSAFDTAGRIGPYMLYRPSSLALFLFMVAGCLYLRDYGGEASWPLRIGVLLLSGALAAPASGLEALGPLRDEQRRLAQHAGLYEFVRGTPRDTVFLIKPDLERGLLGFQRETGRSVPVMFKFMPSRTEDVREWFRRREMQHDAFDGACAGAVRYDVSYLIVDGSVAPGDSVLCNGSIAYRDKHFAVIRLAHR